jgi:serine/arginine repetitive matrix protein 2
VVGYSILAVCPAEWVPVSTILLCGGLTERLFPAFQPPAHVPDMRALLEHSQQNYGPLPQELRAHRIRSRTSSRASPYPAMRAVKRSISPSSTRPSTHASVSPPLAHESPMVVLQDRTHNANTPHAAKAEKVSRKGLSVKKPLPDGEVSPFVPENLGKLSNGLPRARVGSNARRSALGWAKRSTGKENKENRPRGQENVSFGVAVGQT